MTELEAFETRVSPEPNTGCWLWSGPIDGDGYGSFTFGGSRGRRAHRWSYEAHRGTIASGLVVDHLCRVRSCVNPAHLEPVGIGENVLRGVGHTARNAQKTHCDRGHLLEGANVRIRLRGDRTWRECRVCRRLLRQGLIA